jgi:hypothetical protein
MNIHLKDFPEDGLILVQASDPQLSTKVPQSIRVTGNKSHSRFLPFSVLFLNQANQEVVAYSVQWCFQKPDGDPDCYLDSFTAPKALMDGETLSPTMQLQSNKISPGKARRFSLISEDGSGNLRVQSSQEEVDQLKKGLQPDRSTLLDRFATQLSSATDLTVSIEGAFFEDGTFVGENSNLFFEHTKAQIEARRDLLTELTTDKQEKLKSSEEILNKVKSLAYSPAKRPQAISSVEDHYNFQKAFYAKQIDRMSSSIGLDNFLANALSQIRRPWRELRKKRP